jgi:hypothetical protein
MPIDEVYGTWRPLRYLQPGQTPGPTMFQRLSTKRERELMP